MSKDKETNMHHVTMHKAKKAWYKKWWVWILAIIVVGALAGSSGGKKENTSTAKSSSPSTSKAATLAKIGEAANDGKFEFTVKSLECNHASVGTNQYLTKTAQGQYCLLVVTVKNIGDEKQSLFSANQKLLDSASRQYSADDTATLYAAPQGSSWYSDINPGNSVDGTIVFDIPKDATPVTAELHDSAFSGGVKVDLQ